MTTDPRPTPDSRAAVGGARGRPARLSAATRQRLLDAWVAWDAKPGGQTTAGEMVDVVKQAAGELGISMLALRDALATERRAGMDRPRALDRALDQLGRPVGS